MNQIVLISSSALPALVAAAGERANAQITSVCSPTPAVFGGAALQRLDHSTDWQFELNFLCYHVIAKEA